MVTRTRKKKAPRKTVGGPIVGVVMGSDSDWPTLRAAAEILEEFRVPFEKRVVSAHRTPQMMFDYAESARERAAELNDALAVYKCPLLWSIGVNLMNLNTLIGRHVLLVCCVLGHCIRPTACELVRHVWLVCRVLCHLWT